MKKILTTEQMRRADQATIDGGISAFELMQRAGRAVANTVQRVAPDTGRMVIVVGGGNNAGDGYAAAKVLSDKGGRVTVLALTDPALLKGAAAEHAKLADQAGVKIRPACGIDDSEVLTFWLNRAVLVVDAIFGTGLDRNLDGWLREAVGIINTSDRPVLAVDIPSGINSDNGKVMGAAIEADWTLPIAAIKWGHWLDEGRLHHGSMLPPADIGIDPDMAVGSTVLSEKVFAAFAPPARPDLHKGSFGHVWVFGGSEGFTGAPRLASMGAMAVHAGLVSIVCPEEVYAVIAASSLEVMVHRQLPEAWQKADAVVAGPGWGQHQQEALGMLLKSDRVLLLDADALNMLAVDDSLKALAVGRKTTTVFTPHPGEAARLLGCKAAEVQQGRPAALRRLVDQLQGWVVLKGAQTLIGAPDGRVWLCPYGNSRLATAGSGDVLSGMLGGLLGQVGRRGLPVEQALGAAVALHARAGEEKGWHRVGQLPDQVAKLRDALLKGEL